MIRQVKRGRSKGRRNRGYFFRKGRGWCTSEGTRAVPLTYPDGSKIIDPSASPEHIKDALARHRLGVNETESENATSIPVAEVCKTYLEYCRSNNAAGTYSVRAAVIFDFVTGLPARFRKDNRKNTPEAEKARIHEGFGSIPVSALKHFHIDQWLAKHPDWDGGKRTAVQAVLRAFSYCKKAGVIEDNALAGYSVPRSNLRKTYLTPEQEKAFHELARPDFSMALKVCIRTGARPGCEFGKLTAKHVTVRDGRMEWRFGAHENKTGKQTGKARIIRVTDPEIIAIVQRQIERHPHGPIFRNSVGKPWTTIRLNSRFVAVLKRLTKKGIHLDDDACMYSCRHTYAKRTLAGFWTGKPTNIETLSQLMGNSRKVCWEHYAEWCDTYTEPAWSAA